MEETVLHDVSFGALTQLYAGTTKEAAELNGKVRFQRTTVLPFDTHDPLQYLIPWARVGSPHPRTQDPQLGKELWDWMDEQVKGF